MKDTKFTTQLHSTKQKLRAQPWFSVWVAVTQSPEPYPVASWVHNNRNLEWEQSCTSPPGQLQWGTEASWLTSWLRGQIRVFCFCFVLLVWDQIYKLTWLFSLKNKNIVVFGFYKSNMCSGYCSSTDDSKQNEAVSYLIWQAFGLLWCLFLTYKDLGLIFQSGF